MKAGPTGRSRGEMIGVERLKLNRDNDMSIYITNKNNFNLLYGFSIFALHEEKHNKFIKALSMLKNRFQPRKTFPIR